jgi:hypothetical protein
MNLSSWFKLQDKKMKRLVPLEQSVLAGRYKAYGFFRLKYFNLQLLVHYLVHLILIGMVFRDFKHPHASYLILVLALSFIVNSAWWGGLEVMRDDVRYYYKHRMRNRISDLIGTWLLASLLCSFLLIGIALFVLIKESSSMKSLSSIYSLSLISILFSLAIQFPIRVYHSGIYAISRITRTTLSIFISDIVFILTIIMSYPFFKWYSLPLALFLKNSVGQVVTLHFVRQVYHLRDVAIKLPNRFFIRDFISTFPKAKFFKASVCMATFSLDHLLVAIWFFYARNSIQQENMAFLILILPLLYASIDWAKLFYFDYKKDIRSDFSLFYANFEINVIKIAFFSGVLYWLLACVTYMVFMSAYPMTLCIWLLPVFVLRSKMAVLQIAHFAEGHYARVIYCNIIFFGLIVAIYMIPILWMIKALLLIPVCLLLILYLSHTKVQQSPKETQFKKPIHIYSWLESLRKTIESHKIEVHIFHMPSYIKEKSVNTLVKHFFMHFSGTEHELCTYKNQIFLFTNNPEMVSIEKLLLISGGWVYSHQSMAIDSVEMVNLKLLPLIEPPITKKLIHTQSLKELKATFFNHFPHGICFDPKYQLGPKARPLRNEVMRNIIMGARKYLLDEKNNFISGYFISVYYSSSKVKIIFLIPKRKIEMENNNSCHPEVWQRNIDLLIQQLIFS